MTAEIKSTVLSLCLALAMSTALRASALAQQPGSCDIYWRDSHLPSNIEELPLSDLNPKQARDAKLIVVQSLHAYNIHDPHPRWFEQQGLAELYVTEKSEEKEHFVTFHVVETDCPNSRERFKHAVCATPESGIRGCCMASVWQRHKKFKPNYIICNVNAMGNDTEFYWVSETMVAAGKVSPAVPAAVTQSALQLGLYNLTSSVALHVDAHKVNLHKIEGPQWIREEGRTVTLEVTSKLTALARVADDEDDFCATGLINGDCLTTVTLARCGKGSCSQLAGNSGWMLQAMESDCNMECAPNLLEAGRVIGGRKRCPTKRFNTNRNLYCCASMLCQ